MQSNFHAVFNDHQLRIQKHRCNTPDCHWQGTPTTTTVFGTDIHPDLAKLQCEQGALLSYREAQTHLERVNCAVRSINNHTRIQSLTNQMGSRLSDDTLKGPSSQDCGIPATDLIIQVDGGHIHEKEKGKRSIEALSAIVYRPDTIEPIDKHHRQITQKTCVISAKDDELETIGTFVRNAARKQGMTELTQVTGLADGANHCWSVLLSLSAHCQALECILDWFHIGKKFETVKKGLGEEFEESLERAKWTLWHGEMEATLTKLKILQDDIRDDAKQSKIKGLHDYLKNNFAYLINYDERESSGKPYTSQVAELHIDLLVVLLKNVGESVTMPESA